MKTSPDTSSPNESCIGDNNGNASGACINFHSSIQPQNQLVENRESDFAMARAGKRQIVRNSLDRAYTPTETSSVDYNGSESEVYNLVVSDWKLSAMNSEMSDDLPVGDAKDNHTPTVKSESIVKEPNKANEKKQAYYSEILATTAKWQQEHLEFGPLPASHWWNILESGRLSVDGDEEKDVTKSFAFELEKHIEVEKENIKERLKEIERARLAELERLERLKKLALEAYKTQLKATRLVWAETTALNPRRLSPRPKTADTEQPVITAALPNSISFPALNNDWVNEWAVLNKSSDVAEEQHRLLPNVSHDMAERRNLKPTGPEKLKSKQILFKPAEVSAKDANDFCEREIDSEQNIRNPTLGENSITSLTTSAQHEQSYHERNRILDEFPLRVSTNPATKYVELSTGVPNKTFRTGEVLSGGDDAGDFDKFSATEKHVQSCLEINDASDVVRWLLATNAESKLSTTECLPPLRNLANLVALVILGDNSFDKQLTNTVKVEDTKRLSASTKRINFSTKVGLSKNPVAASRHANRTSGENPGNGSPPEKKSNFVLNNSKELMLNKDYNINIRVDLGPYMKARTLHKKKSSVNLVFRIPLRNIDKCKKIHCNRARSLEPQNGTLPKRDTTNRPNSREFFHVGESSMSVLKCLADELMEVNCETVNQQTCEQLRENVEPLLLPVSKVQDRTHNHELINPIVENNAGCLNSNPSNVAPELGDSFTKALPDTDSTGICNSYSISTSEEQSLLRTTKLSTINHTSDQCSDEWDWS